MALLTGKKLLITGISSTRSIAYGIAKVCHEEGAELILTENAWNALPAISVQPVSFS